MWIFHDGMECLGPLTSRQLQHKKERRFSLFSYFMNEISNKNGPFHKHTYKIFKKCHSPLCSYTESLSTHIYQSFLHPHTHTHAHTFFINNIGNNKRENKMKRYINFILRVTWTHLELLEESECACVCESCVFIQHVGILNASKQGFGAQIKEYMSYYYCQRINSLASYSHIHI